MMRFATPADIPGLKTIWSMSFDDPINYIDFFYDKIASPDDTVVFEDAGTIASMLTLIPSELVFRERAVKVAYIYGAATHKKYRSRGVMTALLSFAEERALERGCAMCVLVPGEKYLFDYYKRRGYSADFNCRNVAIKHGMLTRELANDTPLMRDALSPDALFALREESLSGMAHLRWRPRYLASVLLDASVYGEHIESYEGAYGRAYSLWGLHKRHMYIRECLGSSLDAQEYLISRLIADVDPAEVTVQLALQSELFRFEGDSRLYGMAKPLVVNTSIKDMEAYMNLMLD